MRHRQRKTTRLALSPAWTLGYCGAIYGCPETSLLNDITTRCLAELGCTMVTVDSSDHLAQMYSAGKIAVIVGDSEWDFALAGLDPDLPQFRVSWEDDDLPVQPEHGLALRHEFVDRDLLIAALHVWLRDTIQIASDA